MSTIYIVYYDYKNTKGNHAGMAYLAKYLDQNIDEVRLIKNIPQEYKLGKYIAWGYAIFLGLYLALVLKKGDKVIFLEYLTKKLGHQVVTAKLLRFFGLKNKFYALVHYAGKHLLEVYGNSKNILTGLNPIDEIFVFGSSLKDFFESIGVHNKVVTTFHYVDTEFYCPKVLRKTVEKINVLSIGNLKRDFPELKQIISQCSDLDFHICMGRKNIGHFFQGVKNVILYQYLSEIELLQLMQKCDVSISVLEDTIGSNAITTAMAVGLVQVVSDVGSIRDYCTTDNSFFCKSTNDFVMALNSLNHNKEVINKMSRNAMLNAHKFSKETFLSEFKNFIDV
jgi:glycosyltransferase involved in cell wall biosynthesis